MFGHLRALLSNQAFSLANLTAGAVGSLLAALVTYVGTVVYRFRIPTLSDLVFWRFFKKDVRLVVAEITVPHDPNRSEGRPYAVTPLADAIALSETLNHVKQRWHTVPELVSVQSAADFDTIKDKNLVIIGGPKYNFAAYAVLKVLDARLPFQFKRFRVATTGTRADDIDLKALVTPDGEEFAIDTTRDLEHGLLLVCRNPFDLTKRVFLIAGLNQVSTLAVARGLHHLSGWQLATSFFKGDGIEVLYECTVASNLVPTNVCAKAKAVISKSL